MNIQRLYSSIIGIIFIFLFVSGCTSYETYRQITEEFDMPAKTFTTDYNDTWQAVLQIMGRFDLNYQNQEGGIIVTKWIDNTNEVNFSDSFGSSDTIKGAKFKISLNVVKGQREFGQVTKVTIYKRQLIEQDFLQGWKEIPTDFILEQTLLYRVERLLKIDKNLKRIQAEKERKEIEKF